MTRARVGVICLMEISVLNPRFTERNHTSIFLAQSIVILPRWACLWLNDHYCHTGETLVLLFKACSSVGSEGSTKGFWVLPNDREKMNEHWRKIVDGNCVIVEFAFHWIPSFNDSLTEFKTRVLLRYFVVIMCVN